MGWHVIKNQSFINHESVKISDHISAVSNYRFIDPYLCVIKFLNIWEFYLCNQAFNFLKISRFDFFFVINTCVCMYVCVQMHNEKIC